MDVSKNIIAIREEKKIKQSEVADALNTERSNYARLEKRGSKLTLEQLEQIAAALGVTVDYILHYGEPEPENEKESEKIKELEREYGYAKKELELMMRQVIQKDSAIQVLDSYIEALDHTLQFLLDKLPEEEKRAFQENDYEKLNTQISIFLKSNLMSNLIREKMTKNENNREGGFTGISKTAG